jgi:L-alanine-DL-glutamate epimerase-like enolase superfamily enzyme
MVDANQQWDRPTAQRMCRIFEQFNLIWIEEPLDAYDFEGHAALAAPSTPHRHGRNADQRGRARRADPPPRRRLPDARCAARRRHHAFLKIAAQAEQAGLMLGPHFAMELHVHLGAVYPREPWVEHFDWLEPLFNERSRSRTAACWCRTPPGLALR